MSLDTGLDAAYEEALRDVFRASPQVEKVLIFGSRARGDYKPASDIDLAVCAPDMSFDDFALLKARLEDLPLIFKIDLVHKDHLEDQGLRDVIHNEGHVFYAKGD